MDEYITRNNVILAVCFGCNQEFSDEPCEPSECAIRQSIMALPTADVVPKSEVEKLIKSVDDMLDLVCAMTGLELTYFGKYAELKKKYIKGD